nr:unnamed protein product [Callosobruchus chinensis]
MQLADFRRVVCVHVVYCSTRCRKPNNVPRHDRGVKEIDPVPRLVYRHRQATVPNVKGLTAAKNEAMIEAKKNGNYLLVWKSMKHLSASRQKELLSNMRIKLL